MPPLPLEPWSRRAARFLIDIAVVYLDRRLTQTRANGQPALAIYAHDTGAIRYRASVSCSDLAGERVSSITRFEVGVFAHFGLPPTLPAERCVSAQGSGAGAATRGKR